MKLFLALWLALLSGCVGGANRSTPALSPNLSYLLSRGNPDAIIARNHIVYVATRWPSAVVVVDTANTKQTVRVLSTTDRWPVAMAIDEPKKLLWIADSLPNSAGDDSIVSLDRSGHVTEYHLPRKSVSQHPAGIAIDASGAIWYYSQNLPLLGKVDPRTHLVREYRFGPRVTAMSADGLGTIWIVLGGRTIARIVRGRVEQVLRLSSNYYISSLASGNKGRMWFIAISHKVPPRTSLAGYINLQDKRTKVCTSHTQTLPSRAAAISSSALAFATNGHPSSGVSVMTSRCQEDFNALEGSTIEALTADQTSGELWILDGRTVRRFADPQN